MKADNSRTKRQRQTYIKLYNTLLGIETPNVNGKEQAVRFVLSEIDCWLADLPVLPTFDHEGNAILPALPDVSSEVAKTPISGERESKTRLC